jgi:hypothetical protein
MEPRLLHPGAAISVEFRRALRRDLLLQRREIAADHAAATGDRDPMPAGDRENPAAQRAIARRLAGVRPAHNRRRQHGQEIGMARQHAKGAARILGAQRAHAGGVDEQGGRGGDRQAQALAHPGVPAGGRAA